MNHEPHGGPPHDEDPLDQHFHHDISEELAAKFFGGPDALDEACHNAIVSDGGDYLHLAKVAHGAKLVQFGGSYFLVGTLVERLSALNLVQLERHPSWLVQAPEADSVAA